MIQSVWKKQLLVALLALNAWLIPLLSFLLRGKSGRRFDPSPGAPPQNSVAKGDTAIPLLLYVEAWPTRSKLDLREIQGVTQESESSLAPPKLAESLFSELASLGITPEIHRIDRLPETLDLSRFQPIVLIYPVRHLRPSSEVLRFLDQTLEPFIAKHQGPVSLKFTDLTVGESKDHGLAAQTSLEAIHRYYQIPYQKGPALSPDLSIRAEQQLLKAHAKMILKLQ